jgi:hypothetical protein
MAEVAYFGTLVLIALGSAVWFLHDFKRRLHDSVDEIAAQHRPVKERVPEWLSAVGERRRLPSLPPTFGPARLPSFARDVAPISMEKAPAVRAPRRRHRLRASTLRSAG